MFSRKSGSHIRGAEEAAGGGAPAREPEDPKKVRKVGSVGKATKVSSQADIHRFKETNREHICYASTFCTFFILQTR